MILLEFYTNLNFFGMAEDRIANFVHGLAREVSIHFISGN